MHHLLVYYVTLYLVFYFIVVRYFLFNINMLNIITYATWQEERGQAQTHLVEVHVFRSASLNRALDSTMK